MKMKRKIHKRLDKCVYQNQRHTTHVKVYCNEERNFTAVHLF